MKDLFKYGLFGVVLLIVGYFIFQKRKKGTLQDISLDIPEPNPEQQTQILSTTGGEGLQLIENRKRQIFNSPALLEQLIDREEIKRGLYNNLSYKQSMKDYFQATRNNSQDIPLIPRFIDPDFSRKAEETSAMKSFNELMAQYGYEGAKDRIQQGMDFNEWGFDPYQTLLIDTLWTGGFGPINRRDRDRSDNFHRMFEDMKAFFGNIATATRKLDQSLEKQAIEDLRGSGYRFQGYDSGVSMAVNTFGT